MKQRNKLIYATVLLSLCMAITPAMGSMVNANSKPAATVRLASSDLVTIEFADCTNIVPIVKEVTMPRSEWNSVRQELRAINGLSIQDTLIAQLNVFKKHNLVSNDVTSQNLLQKLNRRHISLSTISQKMHASPIINNSVFNAMTAILFTLDNGTTFVLGLNSFLNIIGFDIFSIHKGYTTTDISTTGLLGSRSAPPGQYVGAMFGFFGYWSGERQSIGIYSNLTAAGFTVFTLWLPIPLSP
jgi:hypothetical protein